MENKLEEIKKALEEFSLDKLEEKKEDEIKLDFSGLKWTDLLTDFSTASAATISSVACNPTFSYTRSNAGSGGGGGGSYVFNTSGMNYGSGGGGGGLTGATGSSSGLHVQGKATFDDDLVVKGRNIVDSLKSIEDRLAILVPDPEKLEHFEALKKAYEHYKTLEALCSLPDKKEK